MKVKRGDIYWIAKNPIRPTVGSVQEPGRPGIVVSNDSNNTYSRTVEIVYLTGQPKPEIPTHCTIKSALIPSIALCEQVQTVSTEQIGDYIGQCTEEEMFEINRCITISLGLPDPLEDLRKAMRETAVLMPGEETYDPMEKINELERKLSAAKAREELLQDMYNRLLERTMAG